MSNIYGFIRPTDEYMISIGYTPEQLPAFKALWDDYDAEGPWVYLTHAKGTPYYKIGYSTDPRKRIIIAQTDSPVTLELIAVIRGTSKDEKRLHKTYDHCRVRGEWFSFPKKSADLDSVLAYFADGVLDDDWECALAGARI
jgi:hypothetical protein